MEAVRKIVSADILKPIIDLPWVSEGLRVEVIVIPLNDEQLQKKISYKELKGCLKGYANPALWKNEKQAWYTKTIEKYGNSLIQMPYCVTFYRTIRKWLIR